ncbi:hypothetical protein EMIT0P43_110111 [Pseudomonas jessenii]
MGASLFTMAYSHSNLCEQIHRFREQARSHSWICINLQEIGRLSGRLREQARSHILNYARSGKSGRPVGRLGCF